MSEGRAFERRVLGSAQVRGGVQHGHDHERRVPLQIRTTERIRVQVAIGPRPLEHACEEQPDLHAIRERPPAESLEYPAGPPARCQMTPHARFSQFLVFMGGLRPCDDERAVLLHEGEVLVHPGGE